MIATDKRSLISDSIVATRIDIHLAGEELDRHIVRVAPGVSCRTTVGEVPTKSKLGLCFRDEVLAPSNVWPGCHSGLPHYPSNKPPWSREWQLDKVVTGLLGLPGPKKTRYVASTNQGLPSGQNRPVLNRQRWGLRDKNLGIATSLPTLPFWVFNWTPYLPRPVWQ
jgi:hypothetical protein